MNLAISRVGQLSQALKWLFLLCFPKENGNHGCLRELLARADCSQKYWNWGRVLVTKIATAEKTIGGFGITSG